jgi:hypothetical protein
MLNEANEEIQCVGKGKEDPNDKCKGIVESMQNGEKWEKTKNVGDLLQIVSYMGK